MQRLCRLTDLTAINSRELSSSFSVYVLSLSDTGSVLTHIIAYRRAREAALVLYPHVEVTLIELVRRGYRLAVLSDAPAKQAWLRLCSLGLQHLFETVITPEDTGKRKPHPLPFRKALETLGVTADEAIMIGDWPERDMAGAKAVNIRTVYARYGDAYHSSTSGADREIDDISEILDILDDEEFNQ